MLIKCNPLLTCHWVITNYIKWSSEGNDFSLIKMTKEHAGSGFNSFKIAVGSGGNKVRDGGSENSGNWNNNLHT